MQKAGLAISSIVLASAALCFASVTAEAVSRHNSHVHYQAKRGTDRSVDRASHDITSFSSSSALHIGINHRPGR